MVRDKFIASQRSCDLRRHLDGAAPETSIRDIVDSCRIWESYGKPADIEDSGQSLKRRQRILPRPSPTISNSGSELEVWGRRRIVHPGWWIITWQTGNSLYVQC